MNDVARELVDRADNPIAEYSQTVAALAELKSKHGGVQFEVGKPSGMLAAKEVRSELRSLRTALEEKRKDLKSGLLEQGRLIDGEAKRITVAIVELEEPIASQIKAEEDRKEAEKAAKLEAERLRVEKHRKTI